MFVRSRSVQWFCRVTQVVGWLLLFAPSVLATALYQQTVELSDGWNAVHLHVTPQEDDLSTLLQGTPIESVWTFFPKATQVEFIEDPGEELFDQPGWRAFFAPDQPKAFLSNLGALSANRVYLIKVQGDYSWQVSGRPALRDIDWIPDAFNLVGLHSDPLSPLTFEEYFAGSSAHQAQDMYRLNQGTGTWELILDPSTTMVDPHAAYWIYTDGASDIVGPVGVEVQLKDGIDFGEILLELPLTVANHTEGPLDVVVRDLGGAASLPLLYKVFDLEEGVKWPNLPTPFTVTNLLAGEQRQLILSLRRADFTQREMATTLEVTAAGIRRIIPVEAQAPENVLARRRASRGVRGVGGAAATYAGLWLGSARIQAVSQAHPPIADVSFDLQIEGIREEDVFIQSGAAWRYEDSGSDLGHSTNWAVLTFDDGAWSEASAEFGFGDDQDTNGLPDEATVLSFGSNPNDKHPTYYFRKSFVVTDVTNRYENLRLRMLYDDAAIVYLNGVELIRPGMPFGSVAFDTLALTEVEESDEAYLIFNIPPDSLNEGENICAVEVHGSGSANIDLSFDLGLVGEIREPASDLLLLARSEWRYEDTETDLGQIWRVPLFDDSDWSEGTAEFGYGDLNELEVNNGVTNGTVISSGPDPKTTPPTYYFRTPFVVADTGYTSLDLRLLRDDGAVVYINGHEVLRDNMPEDGAIEFNTFPVTAVGGPDETTFFRHRIPADQLVVGVNVVAVEVHQYAAEVDGANPATAAIPTPTGLGNEFVFPLILHVDGTGQPRLLKEVIVVQDIVDNEPAILTDDSLLSDPRFGGLSFRGNEAVGRRISTAAFDFEGDSVEFGGFFEPNGTIVADIVISNDHPTNPFKHKFHPDHNNLDEQYVGFVEEAYTVTRHIEFAFTMTNATIGVDDPDFGVDQLGGTYKEVLFGLHKNPIAVQGSFALSRGLTTEVLNE